MKLNRLIIFTVLSVFLSLTSCRQEDNLSIDPPADETLLPNSTLANLMSRTSQKDGSFDNIIDNASCLSVQLPVTVIVNGIEVTINSMNDYEDVEAIFDIFDDDIDTLELVYPITVILSDYSTVTVNSNQEFLALVALCVDENADDSDIECIDFQYPIVASVFNEDNELIDTITINSDAELYLFLENLSDFAAVTIDFPITVILFDGTPLTINNIQELQAAIEQADDTCDEDDDNDYNDDDCNDCSPSQLSELFEDCMEWEVDKLERNDEDLEDLYSDFIFEFSTDGNVTVTEDGTTYTGTWEASGGGNSIQFQLNIPELPDFTDSWNLHEIEQETGEVKFDLRKGEDRLRFESDCTSGGGGNTGGNTLTNTLTATDAVWAVDTYLDDGNNETADFIGYEFTFEVSGTLIAQKGNDTQTGSWASLDGGGKLLINLGEEDPLEELNDDWRVITILENRIELEDVSGGNGGTDTLILVRI